MLQPRCRLESHGNLPASGGVTPLACSLIRRRGLSIPPLSTAPSHERGGSCPIAGDASVLWVVTVPKKTVVGNASRAAASAGAFSAGLRREAFRSACVAVEASATVLARGCSVDACSVFARGAADGTVDVRSIVSALTPRARATGARCITGSPEEGSCLSMVACSGGTERASATRSSEGTARTAAADGASRGERAGRSGVAARALAVSMATGISASCAPR